VAHQVTGLGGGHPIGTALTLPGGAAAPDGRADCRVVFATPLLRSLGRSLGQSLGDGACSEPADDERRSLLQALAREELQRAEPLPIGIALARSPELRRACEAALREEAGDCSLQALADAAHLSRRTLERRFQQELATPFSHWRLQVRLGQMVKLWAEGRTLAACATAVGYAHPSALSFMVRRLLGVTPSRLLAPPRSPVH
jgi:AraC-like DNA-binding protein